MRGVGPTRTAAGNWEEGSCDHVGSVVFKVKPASPDVGYFVEFAAPSTTPLRLPDGPLRVVPGVGRIVLEWDDGAKDEQEPIELRLIVRPVARSGEVGRPARVLVKHPGSPPSNEIEQPRGKPPVAE